MVWEGVITALRFYSPRGGGGGGATVVRKVWQLMERCDAHGRRGPKRLTLTLSGLKV